ncbi:MAG: hypothetical protein J6V80_03350 [Clostridia bacterium]|nr:hypothetical protein [Clostridia bacterium]
MRNRKAVVVAFLITVMLLLSVGFAAVSDVLTIIGNAHIDMGTVENTFDEAVKFTAAEATSTTGTGSQADVASYTADDATFTANKLAIVGEQSVFTFTITNESNVDVAITVAANKLSGAANPSNSNTDKFTVSYAYPQGQTIESGESITVVVTVSVKEPVTTATSATFGIELTATSIEGVE